MSKVTFFKTQFPTEVIIEISPALFSEEERKFVNHDLNIEWSLNVNNSYFPNRRKTSKNLKEGEHIDDYRVVKKCNSAMQYLHSLCSLYRVCMRPSVTKNLNYNKECVKCSNVMVWTSALV